MYTHCNDERTKRLIEQHRSNVEANKLCKIPIQHRQQPSQCTGTYTHNLSDHPKLHIHGKNIEHSTTITRMPDLNIEMLRCGNCGYVYMYCPDITCPSFSIQQTYCDGSNYVYYIHYDIDIILFF